MSDHYWLSETQLDRLKPFFPRSHGVPRVDDRRVLSGIIHVLKRGLQWRMHRPNMAHTRPFTIASYAGANWVYLIEYSKSCHLRPCPNNCR